MARGVASGLPHPRQAHIHDYGREAGVARRRKTAARTRVGQQGRLIANPGSAISMDYVIRVTGLRGPFFEACLGW